MNNTHRSIAEIKQQWRTIKLDAKKRVSTYRRECKQTGGGTKPESPNPATEELVRLLPQEFEEGVNEFDSDAPAAPAVQVDKSFTKPNSRFPTIGTILTKHLFIDR